jgi:hypothetical protein
MLDANANTGGVRMKRIIAMLVLGFGSMVFAGDGAETLALCGEMANLEKHLSSNPHAPDLLMVMADLAQKIKIKPKTFSQDTRYQKECGLKYVHSDNFGDFVTYSGVHYNRIIRQYPQSDLADDAAYELIHVIAEDTHNHSDIRIEKKKLLAFLKHYPKSNKREEAQARIHEIDTALKNGEPPIID